MLSIDGGGMRGLFSCAYLQGMVSTGKERFNADLSDIGKEFDLIVGTSTGAILGAGLAAGVPLSDICDLYTEFGSKIFPEKLPESKSKLLFHNRTKLNKIGDEALREVLESKFGDLTFARLFRDRQIGLAVTAVNCSTHRAYVFKTPHDHESNHRDNNVTLVDACLASSAAPIYRSIAVINQTETTSEDSMFIDGGLWANNPVLVALIEALRNTDEDQKDIIGVEVDIALPKKKVKGLDVLSGGERSLVSIAVLLALISVSPPPFLVLDEIDAALDEKNAKRFGETIKEFSKKTQFVIVTHNRATMEVAEALYGVTMSADGTSKLVSLKLAK